MSQFISFFVFIRYERSEDSVKPLQMQNSSLVTHTLGSWEKIKVKFSPGSPLATLLFKNVKFEKIPLS